MREWRIVKQKFDENHSKNITQKRLHFLIDK